MWPVQEATPAGGGRAKADDARSANLPHTRTRRCFRGRLTGSRNGVARPHAKHRPGSAFAR